MKQVSHQKFEKRVRLSREHDTDIQLVIPLSARKTLGENGEAIERADRGDSKSRTITLEPQIVYLDSTADLQKLDLEINVDLNIKRSTLNGRETVTRYNSKQELPDALLSHRKRNLDNFLFSNSKTNQIQNSNNSNFLGSSLMNTLHKKLGGLEPRFDISAFETPLKEKREMMYREEEVEKLFCEYQSKKIKSFWRGSNAHHPNIFKKIWRRSYVSVGEIDVEECIDYSKKKIF